MADGHDKRGRFAAGNKGRPKGSLNKWRPAGLRRKRYGYGKGPDKNSDADAFHRFHALFDGFANDLGGEDTLSTGQKQLACRAASLSLACEDLEKKLVVGAEPNLQMLGTLTGHLVRVMGELGIRREQGTGALRRYRAQRDQLRLSASQTPVVIEGEIVPLDEDEVETPPSGLHDKS
jgi:hypothetical protein